MKNPVFNLLHHTYDRPEMAVSGRLRTGIRALAVVFCMTFMVTAFTACGKEDMAKTAEAKEEISVILPKTQTYNLSEETIKESFPDVSVNIKVYPEEQYYAILKTRLATGNAPDIFSVQPGYAGSNGVESLAQAGYLYPVTDSEALQTYKENQPELLMTSGNDIYGLSKGKLYLGVIYKKEIFEQYHLAIPSCWTEFLDCCETLKKAGVQPLAVACKEKTSFQYGIYQLAANLIYAKNPDYDEQLLTGESSFEDPDTWDLVLKRYMELFEKGYCGDDYLDLDMGDVDKKLADGETAMVMGTQFYSVNMSREDTEEEGFFALPANDAGEPVCYCSGCIGGLCISADASDPALCQEILETLEWSQDGVDQSSLDVPYDSSQQVVQGCRLCNQGWKNEVEIVLETGISANLSGTDTDISDITQAMQQEYIK